MITHKSSLIVTHFKKLIISVVYIGVRSNVKDFDVAFVRLYLLSLAKYVRHENPRKVGKSMCALTRHISVAKLHAPSNRVKKHSTHSVTFPKRSMNLRRFT